MVRYKKDNRDLTHIVSGENITFTWDIRVYANYTAENLQWACKQ